MINRFEKKNDGKVGVGFCPQNAFGSAVGLCHDWSKALLALAPDTVFWCYEKNLSYARWFTETAWLKSVRDFINPCSEKRVDNYWRDGRTEHCGSCCHEAWIAHCRALEPVGCCQRDGSASSKLTVTLVRIDCSTYLVWLLTHHYKLAEKKRMKALLISPNSLKNYQDGKLPYSWNSIAQIGTQAI